MGHQHRHPTSPKNVKEKYFLIVRNNVHGCPQTFQLVAAVFYRHKVVTMVTYVKLQTEEMTLSDIKVSLAATTTLRY